MRIQPFLFFVFCTAELLAQPVLEYPAAIPAFGPQPIVARSYGVVPGIVQSGTGVLWDLSAVNFTEIGTTTDSILDPSTTPYTADYPDATHAVRLVDQFGYYRVDASGVEDLGYRLGPTSSSFIYSDPARIVQFPSEVGESWSDQTQSGSTNTTLTVTLLAEGELRLNDGSIPDAVLIRREYVGSSSTAISTTWFRRSDVLRPLGNLLTNGAVIVRAPIEVLTALNEHSSPAGISIFPNPCAHLLTVALPNTGSAALQLCDATGRVVLNARGNGDRVQLDLTDLGSGAYSLRVEQDGSVHHWQRIVKE